MISLIRRVACITLLIGTPALAAPTTNPAEAYPQIFESLDSAGLGKAIAELDEVDSTPLNEKTATFLKRHEASILALRDAAKLPAAEWDPTVSVEQVLSRSNPARLVAHLLVLQSRYELSQGRPAQAADDLLAVMAMGRHLGRQNLLIAHLVAVGTEAMAIERLTALVPSLPRDVAQQLPAKLAALPKASSGKEMLMAEFEYGTAESRKQGEQMALIFQAAKPFYEAVGDAMAQPSEQFAKTVEVESAKLPLNPFVRIVAPSLVAAQRSMATLQVRQAELTAAIDLAVQQGQ